MHMESISAHHLKDHLAHNITVKIPQALSHKVLQRQSHVQPQANCQQIVVLPLESARIVTAGAKKRKIASELKFIHVTEEVRNSPLAKTRIGKVKNLVFRPKLQKFISEEKTRLATLEETMMLERQRRLNKEEMMKKMQRLVSPKNIKQRGERKFVRRDDKKNENKKFKRVKEKEEPSQQQKMIQAKLIKKLREDQQQMLSRIAEHMDENFTETLIQPSKSASQLQGMFVQTVEESIIEESPLKSEIVPQVSANP